MKNIKLLLLCLLLLIFICSSVSASATSIRVGDYVNFGHYPQTVSGTDSTPIQWYVLDEDDGAYFLISRYILDCVPFNSEDPAKWSDAPAPSDASPWATSNIRLWLQETFIPAAFTNQERRNICCTRVSNTPYEGDRSFPESTETVYLLNVQETIAYLGCISREDYFSADSSATLPLVTRILENGTPYMTSKFWSSIEDPDYWEYMGEEAWWTRDCDNYPYAVNWHHFEKDFDFLHYGIRPVMWVNASAF